MSGRTIELTGIGPVTLVKYARSRSLRLSVTANGVRVSMPKWTPYSAGQSFVIKHIDWIQQELAKQTVPILTAGQHIGKLHTLRFEQVSNHQTVSSWVTGTEIVVRVKPNETSTDTAAQKRAYSASIRALKREAERLLPPRLRSLAATHGCTYNDVHIKQLKRRWGSCDSNKTITLNLFLMELPWDHIDYVILHELAHTTEMNHGPNFWRTLTAMNPQARTLSKQLRSRQPTIGA